MADHTVSLSVRREAALQEILDEMNRPPFPNAPAGTMTKDDLIRDWVLTLFLSVFAGTAPTHQKRFRAPTNPRTRRFRTKWKLCSASTFRNPR